MADERQIREYAEAVANRFGPEKVVLFGSHAYGSPGDDSDVDLLILMNHEGKRSDQALAIRKAVRKRFPLDLIVRTPVEAERGLRTGDPFMTEILTNGRVLYARD
jgi:predicted nucleotidyltransferase